MLLGKVLGSATRHPALVVAAGITAALGISQSPPRQPAHRASLTACWCCRGATASAVLLGWFYVQIHSDASHLLGHTASDKKIDSYWPISEMSMFAKPSADTSFQITGGLTTILLAFLLFRMFSAGKWLRRQHEAAAAEGSAQN